MNVTSRATLLALLCVPSLAAAQVSLGLRAAYAIPSGDLQKDSKLSDQIKSSIPIQLDVLYRLTKATSVGLYGSYGIDQVASALKDRSTLLVGSGASYDATTWRAGVQATHAFTDGMIVPWVGVGSGIEIGTFEVKNGGAKITGTTRGWEWVNVQLGGDYTVSSSLALGIYAQWAVGQFTYQGGEVRGSPGGFFDGKSGGGLGSEAATHNWWTFGLRGRFDL